MKQFFYIFMISLVTASVSLGLLFLGAWLDAGLEPSQVIIKKEKVIECQPTSKGWSVCKTEWI
jgi:hypothetical protein